MAGRIGIALGDVTGIGPEVALKAIARLAPQGEFGYLVIGDGERVRILNQQLQLGLSFDKPGASWTGKLLLHDPLKDPLPSRLEAGSPLAARAALAYLQEGAQRCLRGELDALV